MNERRETMKRRIMVSLVVVVMLVGSAYVAAAHGPGFGRNGDRAGMHLERMAQVLDLTAAQKEKVSAIVKAEQEKTAPLRQQLADNHEQFRKLTLSEKFDEAAVRALAAKQAQIKTEMMVSHAKAKSEIYALLTPEQRTLPRSSGRWDRMQVWGGMGRCWDNE
jgi:Spy/CpxP family protein refolding chaperone